MADSILFLLSSDKLGGAELILKNIAKYYIKNEFNVIILFIKKRKFGGWDDLSEQCEMYFSKYNRESLTIFYQINKAFNLSKEKNILFTYSSHTILNGLWGIFRKIGFFKTKYYILRESTLILDRFHGVKRTIFKSAYIFGYSNSDLVICQTELMKDRLISSLPIAKKWNLKVIPNLVDRKYIEIMSNSDIPSHLTFKYILGVGRLIELKGFDYLIKAFSRIEDKGLRLVILGNGTEERKLRSIASNLGVENRVFFEGYQSNPFPYIAGARLNVVSSTIEGFPNTLLQMMVLSNNVVSTRCAGGIENIQGLISCETSSDVKLLEAMNKSLNLNQDDIQKTRKLFDIELNKRSLESFVSTVEKYVK